MHMSLLELVDEAEHHLLKARRAESLVEAKAHAANASVAMSSLRAAIERPTGEFPPMSRAEAEAVPEYIGWPDEKTERAPLPGGKAGGDRKEMAHEVINLISASQSIGQLMVKELRKAKPDVAQLVADLADVIEKWDRLRALIEQLWNLPGG